MPKLKDEENRPPTPGLSLPDWQLDKADPASCGLLCEGLGWKLELFLMFPTRTQKGAYQRAHFTVRETKAQRV